MANKRHCWLSVELLVGATLGLAVGMVAVLAIGPRRIGGAAHPATDVADAPLRYPLDFDTTQLDQRLASNVPAIRRAAELELDALLVGRRIAAIEYLGGVSNCYDIDGKVTQALLAGMDDLNEDVRCTAVREAGRKLGALGSRTMIRQLAEIAQNRSDEGLFVEPSPRVRAAARTALGSAFGSGPMFDPDAEEVTAQILEDEILQIHEVIWIPKWRQTLVARIYAGGKKSKEVHDIRVYFDSARRTRGYLLSQFDVYDSKGRKLSQTEILTLLRNEVKVVFSGDGHELLPEHLPNLPPGKPVIVLKR